MVQFYHRLPGCSFEVLQKFLWFVLHTSQEWKWLFSSSVCSRVQHRLIPQTGAETGNDLGLSKTWLCSFPAGWGMAQQGFVEVRAFHISSFSNPSQERQTQSPHLTVFLKTVACTDILLPGTFLPPHLTPARKQRLAQTGICAWSILLIICKTHTSKAGILKHGQCTINLFLITQLYFGLAIKTAAVMDLCGCRCDHIKNELCTVGYIHSQTEQTTGEKRKKK